MRHHVRCFVALLVLLAAAATTAADKNIWDFCEQWRRSCHALDTAYVNWCSRNEPNHGEMLDDNFGIQAIVTKQDIPGFGDGEPMIVVTNLNPEIGVKIGYYTGSLASPKNVVFRMDPTVNNGARFCSDMTCEDAACTLCQGSASPDCTERCTYGSCDGNNRFRVCPHGSCTGKEPTCSEKPFDYLQSTCECGCELEEHFDSVLYGFEGEIGDWYFERGCVTAKHCDADGCSRCCRKPLAHWCLAPDPDVSISFVLTGVDFDPGNPCWFKLNTFESLEYEVQSTCQ